MNLKKKFFFFENSELRRKIFEGNSEIFFSMLNKKVLIKLIQGHSR